MNPFRKKPQPYSLYVDWTEHAVRSDWFYIHLGFCICMDDYDYEPWSGLIERSRCMFVAPADVHAGTIRNWIVV